MKTCPKCDDQHDRDGLCDCGRGPENEKTGVKKRKYKKPYIVESKCTDKYIERMNKSIWGFLKRKKKIWEIHKRYKTKKDAENAVAMLNKNGWKFGLFGEMYEYRVRDDNE